MAVEVIDFRRTPFGWVDCLILYLMVDGQDVPLMVITDNQDFADLLDTMIGMPFTIVVDDDELEVWRIGRRLYAELTTEDLPISPLYMEFKGWSGGPEFESGSEEFPTGYTSTMEMMYFYADVTVDCHGIDCVITTIGMVSPHIIMNVVPP